jgi:hypothetical protein
MNDALNRLRNADPATTAADPRSPHAQAMLERIVAEAPRSRPRSRRRLAFGIVGAAVAAAVATFFIVDPAAAYTVDKKADGSVVLRFRADRLNDPAKLNVVLARAGARTVVYRLDPRCTAPLDLDPAFPFQRNLTQEQLDRYPVSFQVTTNGLFVTIRPDKMPPGDLLAFGFLSRGNSSTGKPAVVRTLPTCMAVPTRPAN